MRYIKDAEANDMIHMGSENRCVMATFVNKTDTITETTEAIESDNMTETRDDRLGHRMLTDDCVIDLCDISSTTTSEDRVQRRACQDHVFGAFQAKTFCDLLVFLP